MDLQGMYERAFRRALLLTGQRESAEDAAQEAVARLLGQDAGKVHNPGAWLMLVASRLAYDILRRRRREIVQAEPPDLPSELGDPARQVIRQEEARQVRTALNQLAPRDRTLLMLRQGGATYQEIARTVGCSPGSVGTLLARAERRFKACYETLVDQASRDR